MLQKKIGKDNDGAVPPGGIRPDVAHRVTHSKGSRHTAAAAETRPHVRSRRIPYLWCRNGIWQFQRRLPQKVVANGAPAFVSASLRTQVLPEAMRRAAALLAAMERIEKRIMAQSAVEELDAKTVKLIVAEVVRAALAELLETETTVGRRTEAEADAAAIRLTEEIRDLRAALRLRDGTPARSAIEQAMVTLHLSADMPVPGLVERGALGGMLDVREAAALLDEGRSLPGPRRRSGAGISPVATSSTLVRP